MAPKRAPATTNPQSPQDSLSLATGQPFPRSNSPSGGFTQFLTRPAKWFGRSASNPKISSTVAADQPRNSSSSTRKHKISRPTDPRPILDAYAGAHGARSVMDLNGRNPSSLDLGSPFNHDQPPSPSTSQSTSGLGDLRNISRRGWSKSADDLVRFTPTNITVDPSIEERIAQYRNRSNSNGSVLSPSTPTSPSPLSPLSHSPGGQTGGPQPFPSVEAPPITRSRSPTVTAPVVSISISAPTVDEASTSPASTPDRVHTRSHSFTPKLSSKLSAPRFIPPSPKRKGSAGSEVENVSPASSVRGVFPFSSKSQPPVPPIPDPSQHRTTAFLQPPTILEPGETEDPSSPSSSEPRRASQIVYNSGFINKFLDTTSDLQHVNIAPNKAWKPFKLELKGSKLYFYKPPGDRATGIKDLFPSELVPASQQDDDEPNVVGEEEDSFSAGGSRGRGGGRKDDLPTGRKKRAFWGRRTHPDLVRDGDGNIEKGTFEALTHEAVFGTTFFVEEADDEEKKQSSQLERWKDFAASVLLCMPYLVDSVKFEAELTRCCENLIAGAEEGKKGEDKNRVRWLIGEYLRFHGKRVQISDLEDADAATGGEAISSSPSRPALHKTSSMQAVFNPTPVSSPHLGMFSPRPGAPSGSENPMSLASTLGESIRDSSGPSPTKSYFDANQKRKSGSLLSAHSSPPWASALDREGLSRDVFLLIEPKILAKSLGLFHCSVLQQFPDNLTADFVFSVPESTSSAGADTAASRRLSSSSSHSSSFSALFGSDDHPHWLTKLLMLQILGADTSTGFANTVYNPLSSPGRGRNDDPSTQHHSRQQHSRSELISSWIRVGEMCRLNGDECSWKAIMQAICSAPIARLEKIWKKVDPASVATVESWVQLCVESDSSGIKEPRITPWGGDIRNVIKEELSKVSGQNGEILSVPPIEKAKNLFEAFRTSFSLCPRKTVIAEEDTGEDVKKLVSYWRDLLVDGSVGGIAAKFQRIEQFMSLSLAAEPRRKGLYEPYHSAKSPNTPPSFTSLIPLLFPDPLPTITIIDRNSVLRGRLDSDTTDIQHLRAVDGHLRPETHHRPVSNPLGNGPTFIPAYNGDLLLAAQNPNMDSVPSSRPSSLVRSRPPSSVIDVNPADAKTDKPVGRTPSIRVKPGTSAGLDRKSSLARRNSLPSLSKRQPVIVSETSSEPPLRVIVQAGTAERLVEVLVHGLPNMAVSVSDDNGEMSLREGGTRELLLDHKEFARVWWNVFRSFMTPMIFFELLRKIYLKAQTPGSAISVEDYTRCISSRTEVFETMKTWMSKGGGAQDMLDDMQLLHSIRSFLESLTDHFIPSSPNFQEPAVKQAWETLNDTRQFLKRNVNSFAMRPPMSRVQSFARHAVTTTDSRVRNLSTREPPDMDRMSVEEFVDNLDGMAFAAFNNVNEEDLYATSDYLEVQSADRTGWFLSRDLPTIEELVEIQNIHTHLQEVEPSSLISEMSPESLYRVLPPGVRSCLRAHMILRKWLISKLVAPKIGLRARQNRMEYLLQAIEVSRLRSTEAPSPNELANKPCVRSFVEAVITSAILSTESRLYQRAWQNVAMIRGCQCDSLAAYLARPKMKSVSSQEPLTIDLGWLIERLLDVISMPDMVEPTAQEGQNLVNFDKRRNLCNFISNAPSLLSRRLARQDDINRCGFERLSNIDRAIHSVYFDYRTLKDEAARETMSSSAGAPTPKKMARPFQKLITLQMEKSRRDKNMRSRLQKEKHHEQARNEKREEMLNKAMRGGRRPPVVATKHRNKKSMSALFNFMRPLSTAFGAETAPAMKRTASELDFVPTGKPSLVLNLTDSRVLQFINNERSYTFQLDTEDGGHYLLQALSKREMNKWIETLTRVSNIAAKRRLTYMGSPKPQVADHIQAQPATATRDPTAVFGVELEFLLEREHGSRPVPPGSIPMVLDRCLAEIEARGLTEQGIYRMAGAASDITSLKDAFNRGACPVTSLTYIHAVCDLVKTWFRVLPEPIFPPSMYHEFIASTQLESLDDRIACLRKLIHRLPQANFDVLKRIAEHLDTVTDYEEHNQMTAEGLSIVWSPNLLRAPQNDFLMALANMPHSHKLVKTLITHFHVIFDDTDPEAEAEQEDELDTPIEEEEEGEDDDSMPFVPDLESIDPELTTNTSNSN